MAQGTTTFPTTIDAARTNPSNVDSSEAAIIAMQTRIGVQAAIAANGALSIGGGQYVVTKAGVCAMTLAAPTVDGTRITVTSYSDNAHTITATALVHDGTTGTHTTGTFAAFKGSSVTLEAWGGFWLQVCANAVTWA